MVSDAVVEATPDALKQEHASLGVVRLDYNYPFAPGDIDSVDSFAFRRVSHQSGGGGGGERVRARLQTSGAAPAPTSRESSLPRVRRLPRRDSRGARMHIARERRSDLSNDATAARHSFILFSRRHDKHGTNEDTTASCRASPSPCARRAR